MQGILRFKCQFLEQVIILFMQLLYIRLLITKQHENNHRWIYPQPWPEDALELVANKFLDDVEMSQEVRDETVIMCKHFHQSVRALSEK